MLEGSIFDCTRVIITPLGVWPGTLLRRYHQLKTIFGSSTDQYFSSEVACWKEQCPRFLDDRG